MVARLVRDQKVAGSNPVTSTKKRPEIFGFPAFSYAICTKTCLWHLFLEIFCNLSKYTKRPQVSICSGLAISRHNILHFSKRPSQFARKRHRLEQPRPAALPSLICRFVWKSPSPPGEPPTPAAHNYATAPSRVKFREIRGPGVLQK